MRVFGSFSPPASRRLLCLFRVGCFVGERVGSRTQMEYRFVTVKYTALDMTIWIGDAGLTNSSYHEPTFQVGLSISANSFEVPTSSLGMRLTR